jgi:ABC-type glutathione transport system ATPase component
MLIQKALVRLLEGRTGLVIAHRLATIRNADRIIVLQNGATDRAAATTTTLMEKLGGLYSKLYTHELFELRRPARQCRRQCRRGSGEGDLGRSAAGAVGDPLPLAGEGARLQSPHVPSST